MTLADLYESWKQQPQMPAFGGLLHGDMQPMKEWLGVGKPWPKYEDVIRNSGTMTGAQKEAAAQEAYDMALNFNPVTSVPLVAGINKMNVPSKDIMGVLKRIQKAGGDSISLNDLTRPTSGYMVAPSKSTERIIPKDKLSKQAVESYIDDFHGLLGQPGNHLGAWVDDGDVYLDVSRNVPKQWKAKRDAVKADQEAIWDMMNMRGIRTK